MPTLPKSIPARLLATLVLLLTMALPARAALMVSGFVDQFDMANWTLVTAGDGRIEIVSAPKQVILYGADDASGPTDQMLLIDAPVDAWVSFDWSYATFDISPVYDVLGYWINGQFTEVVDVLAGASQFGSGGFQVSKGDRFGFVLNSFDSSGGQGMGSISAFVFTEIERSTVPLPGTVLLALSGLALLRRGLRNRKVPA